MTLEELKRNLNGIHYLLEKAVITPEEADKEIEYYTMAIWLKENEE